MSDPTRQAKARLALLRKVIDDLGFSDRQFAKAVLSRDERTLRRWLAGSPMPDTVYQKLVLLNRKRPTKKSDTQVAHRTYGATYPHSGFQVLPIHYRIALNASVPYIHVACYAVNFTKSDLILTSVVASQLFLPNGVALDNLEQRGEQLLPALSSKQVFLNAKLVDSEVRAVSVRPHELVGQASIQLIASARSGNKSLTFTASALTIHGWREGLAPPQPS